MLRVLDLFSGIGGFSLGLERTGGFQTVAFCEIDPFCRRVLAKHWPGVPCYDDVRTLTADALARDGIGVDVICGGFPCQDISSAGKRFGLSGQRSGLWFEYHRLIGELRPRFVLVENVSELLFDGLGAVCGSLAKIGYDSEWHCIPASAINAPHVRDRVWVIGYPQKKHEASVLTPRIFENESRSPFEFRASGDNAVLQHVGRATTSLDSESALCSVDDGVSQALADAHLSALGNAVVPQIPELIGRAILEAL